MIRPAFAAVLILLCAATAAQEIDVFDQNDFIDPRQRGAVFSDRPWDVTNPGETFYLVRLYGGWVKDYQWRTTSTDADAAFLHAAGSIYSGSRQYNLKLTTFQADDDAKLPSNRLTFQLGQYFNLPSVFHPDKDRHITNRLLLTWAVEDNPYRYVREATRRERFNHEFGIESDVQIGNVDGAFIWMRRRIEAGEYVDRVSYLYRLRERVRSNDRLRLNASLGFGTERTDAWHCCLVRAVLTATFNVPIIDTGVNVAWAPTFSPGAQGRRTHSEFAFYLDRTVIARLRDITKR